MAESTHTPSIADALIPLSFLAASLGGSIYLFGDSSSSGANQVALLLATFIVAIVGLKNGYKWQDVEAGMIKGISLSLNAILILFAVGALIGTWILCGTVPTLIYIALQIISPDYFYAASCLLCATVAISIGSSWTVAGTLGIGLMSVSAGLSMDPAITAGAIVSGAYFGDKMSPLSETTNMASAVGGSNLFEHIQHMTYSTFPSFGVALLAFLFLGFSNQEVAEPVRLQEVLTALKAQFDIGWYLLLPVILLLILAAKKVPVLPSIFLGALTGALFAVLFQPEVIEQFVSPTFVESRFQTLLKGIWIVMYDGFKGNSGNELIDGLLSRGGMGSMLTTVWLILCAMAFGGVLESTGLLSALINRLIVKIKRTGSLIAATLATCIGVNLTAADQYIGVILSGRMFQSTYRERGLAPVNLSRALEDAGTVTSALVPWNTCGAYMSATLGVATWSYAPYAIFNWIMPLIAAVFAYTGFKILYVTRREMLNQVSHCGPLAS